MITVCEPPDFYLFHFHLICEIRCTLRQISWELFTGLRWKLYIWVALGLRILLILVSWGKTVYFRKSQIFHLHFFTEEINYFKKVLMRNLLFSHKNRCQIRKPKYTILTIFLAYSLISFVSEWHYGYIKHWINYPIGE